MKVGSCNPNRKCQPHPKLYFLNGKCRRRCKASHKCTSLARRGKRVFFRNSTWKDTRRFSFRNFENIFQERKKWAQFSWVTSHRLLSYTVNGLYKGYCCPCSDMCDQPYVTHSPPPLLWLARFEYKNSPDILHGVGWLMLQRCYSVFMTATHFWAVWADDSLQSDSCLGLLRSDTGCRRFSAFPDAFFFLAVADFSLPPSGFGGLGPPPASRRKSALRALGRHSFITRALRGRTHIWPFWSIHYKSFFFCRFSSIRFCIFFFFFIGNYSDREEPSVWGMEESTSTCLYGVLLLQCDQSRGVPGRREGSC